jgi:hypothetical protein
MHAKSKPYMIEDEIMHQTSSLDTNTGSEEEKTKLGSRGKVDNYSLGFDRTTSGEHPLMTSRVSASDQDSTLDLELGTDGRQMDQFERETAKILLTGFSNFYQLLKSVMTSRIKLNAPARKKIIFCYSLIALGRFYNCFNLAIQHPRKRKYGSYHAINSFLFSYVVVVLFFLLLNNNRIRMPCVLVLCIVCLNFVLRDYTLYGIMFKKKKVFRSYTYDYEICLKHWAYALMARIVNDAIFPFMILFQTIFLWKIFPKMTVLVYYITCLVTTLSYLNNLYTNPDYLLFTLFSPVLQAWAAYEEIMFLQEVELKRKGGLAFKKALYNSVVFGWSGFVRMIGKFLALIVMLYTSVKRNI